MPVYTDPINLEEKRPKRIFNIPADIEPMIRAAADEYNIPFERMASVVKAESNFNPKAISPAGAIGLAQLMPGTAKELGVNPNDPIQNLRGGAKYLRKMYDQFGDWDQAHASYNAGPARVKKYGGIPPIRETQGYVKKINNFLNQFGDENPIASNQPIQAKPELSPMEGADPNAMKAHLSADFPMAEGEEFPKKKESLGKKIGKIFGFGREEEPIEYDEFGIAKPQMRKAKPWQTALNILLPIMTSMFGGAGMFPGLQAGYFANRMSRNKQYNEDMDRYAEMRKAKLDEQKSMKESLPDGAALAKWYMNASPEEQRAFQNVKKINAEANPYAAERIQLARDSFDRQARNDQIDQDYRERQLKNIINEKKENRNDRYIEKLSGRLGNSQEAVNTLEDVQNELGFDLDSYDPKTNKAGDKKVDLPGVSLPGLGRVVAYDKGARSLDDTMQKLFNIQLKDRSGAAVTNSEMERLKDEWSKGKFNSESEMLVAMKKYKKALASTMQNIEAGFDPEVVSEYENRLGVTSKRLKSKNSTTPIAQNNVNINEKSLGLDREYTLEELEALEAQSKGK